MSLVIIPQIVSSVEAEAKIPLVHNANMMMNANDV